MINRVVSFARGLLACPVTPIELLQRGIIRAALQLRQVTSGSAGAFNGRTNLASGAVFATVSCVAINSDSNVQATFQPSAAVSSGQSAPIGVMSIVSGTSFAVGYWDGAVRAPGGTVMWEIKRTS